MSEILGNDTVSEQSQTDAVEQLDIASLRRFAAIMKIPASRNWSKEDYVTAIKAKQESNSLATFVFDANSAPVPGKARIVVHRDPTPNHKNSPLHIGVNGYIVAVPRGLEVDIPIPFVEALKNAISTELNQAGSESRDNPAGVYRDERRASYPFQVIAITPGDFMNPHDNRAVTYVAKKKFFDKYGSWPTDAELKELKKAQINKDL